ncbi:MAG: 1-acyl-sn-glycerol-3-phosphate acyltransferase [Parvicellaceae bacterium]|jgi:1-acyl-sn-glycerol-3-phosphate acyltransferase
MKGVAHFFYWLLTRRYRVKLKGIDLLKIEGAKLILPNHPAHIDPQLMAAIVRQHCDFVPVVSERFAKTPIISYFMKKQNAVAVSDLKYGKRDPDVLKKIEAGVKDAFSHKRSVIIYPAGGIKSTSLELVRNKQSVHYLAKNLPDDVMVLGVRIKGLWGSMWSVAWYGERPKFLWCVAKGLFYLFANFIFLLPKRDVEIEFVDITEEIKANSALERREFNKTLEEFYNVDGPDPVIYLKHFFYAPKLKRKYPSNLKG